MESPFIDLLQYSMGIKKSFNRTMTPALLSELFSEAKRQAVLGICYNGISEIIGDEEEFRKIKHQWINNAVAIEKRNEILDKQTKELSELFLSKGLRSCILKGRGIAMLYPNSDLRQPGDIDIWVEGSKTEIVKATNSIGNIRDICFHHAESDVFHDTKVEVHFMPSWFFNPITHIRFKKWVKQNQERQFSNKTEYGYCIPTIEFNLVFTFLHIFRHVFDDGVGIRQLMDYYYILINSSEQERKQTLGTLKKFHLEKFCGAVMYILTEVFDLDSSYLLCPPSSKDGLPVLKHTLKGGNFAKSLKKPYKTRVVRELRKFRKGFLFSYPSELFWLPLWKFWHYFRNDYPH